MFSILQKRQEEGMPSLMRITLLVTLFVWMLSLSAFADEKIKPTAAFTPISKTAEIEQEFFQIPTFTIKNTDGKSCKGKYVVAYSFSEGTEYTIDTVTVGDEYKLTDKTTGTVLNTYTGDVTIGNKSGSVTIVAHATPADKYANDYEEVSAQYTITINVPDNFVFTLQSGQNKFSSEDAPTKSIAVNTTTKPGWLVSTTVVVNKPKVTYDFETVTTDVTSSFTYNASLSENAKQYFNLNSGSDNWSISRNYKELPADATDLYITFTATPSNTESYGTKTVSTRVNLTSMNITNETKYLYLKFPKHEQDKYKVPENFDPLDPQVVDENGIDYTDKCEFSFQPVENKSVYYNYSDNPLDSLEKYNNVDLVAHPNYETTYIYGKDNAYCAECPDDYLITCKATIYDWSLGQIYAGVIPYPDSTYEVKGMLYGIEKDYGKNENKYLIQSNQYILHNHKRVPDLVFEPDPNSIKVARNYAITPDNRFTITGVFDNKYTPGDGEPTVLHEFEGDGFYYYYFVPDAYSWDKFKTNYADSATADNALVTDENLKGQVRIEMQNIPEDFIKRNEKQYVDMPQADGTIKKELVTGTRYYSRNGFNKEADLFKIIFHGEGKVPLSYTICPWNYVRWDVADSSQTVIYNIYEIESIHMVVIPPKNVINVNSVIPKPDVFVYDQFGKDITKYYNITFKFKEATQGGTAVTDSASVISSTGVISYDKDSQTMTGKNVGDVKWDVFATKKTDDATKKNWEYYNVTADKDTASYEVEVTNNQASYEIIYDKDYYNSTVYNNGNDDHRFVPNANAELSYNTRMGKFHFISGGKVHPGAMVFNEMPGLNVTFGSADEAQYSEDGVVDDWSVEADNVDRNTLNADGTTQVEDVRNDGTTETTSLRFVTVTGPAVFGLTTDADGTKHAITVPDADHKIPLSGGFLKLQPTTNGFLTIDRNSKPYKLGGQTYTANYVLYDASLGDDKNNQTDIIVSSAKDNITAKAGDREFRFALMAGHTYYLYSTGTSLRIHGLLFKPGFVRTRYATQPYSFGKTYMNGYTGSLPYLLVTPDDQVKFYSSKAEDENWTTDKTVASVDESTGEVKAHSRGKAVIRSLVKGIKYPATTEGGNVRQVARVPHFLLKVGQIPTYMVSKTDVLVPGDRRTTTNIATRIWMTLGGWDKDTQENPYFKNNNLSNAELALEDDWGVAQHDTVGRDHSAIDGFSYVRSGMQNPTDEKVVGWDKTPVRNTFSLPVRGAYLKFEPEESGTLMVYILQNGMTDVNHWNKLKRKNDAILLRRRACYIVDETGKPVDMTTSDLDWSQIGDILDNPDNSHKNYYSLGIIRSSFNELGEEFKFDNWTNLKFLTDEQKKQEETDIKAAWKSKSVGDAMEIIKLQDGSFVTPTKAYVRYTFDVKAGKTYYVYVTGSKLGFCGFSFIPVGFNLDQKLEKWCPIKDENTVYTSMEMNEDETETMAQCFANMPEPGTDATVNGKQVYQNECGTTASVTLSNNETYTTPTADINFTNVTLNRSFKNGKWTSICLPFSMTETKVHEIFGNDAQVIVFDSVMNSEGHEGWAHFTMHVNQLLEAGRPYFINLPLLMVRTEQAWKSNTFLWRRTSSQ